MSPVLFVASVAAIGILLALPFAAKAYFRFRDPRVVPCPETGLAAEVQLDAWHAAATAVPGPPRLYVTRCSRWPEHAGCRQLCLGHPAMG